MCRSVVTVKTKLRPCMCQTGTWRANSPDIHSNQNAPHHCLWGNCGHQHSRERRLTRTGQRWGPAIKSLSESCKRPFQIVSGGLYWHWHIFPPSVRRSNGTNRVIPYTRQVVYIWCSSYMIVSFSNSFYKIAAWVLLVKLLSGDRNRTPRMRCQHWLR